MSNYAILKGHTVVAADPVQWSFWFATNHQKRSVGDDTIDGVRISTVFIGLDHNWSGGEPHWFETMVFGGAHGGYRRRYSTWDEAVAGHAEALKLVTE